MMVTYEVKKAMMEELVNDVEYRAEFSNQICNWVKEYKALAEESDWYVNGFIDGIYTMQEMEKKVEANSKRSVKIMDMVAKRVLK